jgi:plastocyanin
MWHRAGRDFWIATLLVAAVPPGAEAQAVVDRTPNLADSWTVPPGVIQFNFLHRLEVSAPPVRKVTSFPNLHIATGLPLGVNAAIDYTTNSTVFSGIPNEYQLGLRRPIVRQSSNTPLDMGLVAAYNFAAQSFDGELSLGRRLGPIRLLGTVRGISSGYDAQRSLWGVGTGLVVRLTSWLSVAGDVFDLVDAPDAVGGTTAWGAGAQLRIPYSPHSVSIQLTNTQNASIEGAARGIKGAHLAGFEFTIPFTLSRYFGRRERPTPDAAIPERDGQPAVAQIANFAFNPGDIRVRAGTRVRWVNGDRVEHSVTAADGSFDSGLIGPGHAFERVFDRPGSYAYHCTPHPFMSGRVIVEPAGQP